MENSGFDFKKIFFAGVGAIAMTAEKAGELVSELAEKGEITVEQSKVLNEELKRNVSTKVRSVVDSVIPPKEVPLADRLDALSPEELAALKAKLAELEQKREPEQGEE